MMRQRLLSELLHDVTTSAVAGSTAITVSGITADSRGVAPGMAFVAIPGFRHDGHTFAPEAIARGARALLVQRPVSAPDDVTVITVPDTRIALAWVSAAFYDYPSRQMDLIGITGTNGKGTTAALIDAILTGAGLRTGIIGTLGARIGDRAVDMGHTTPDAPQLQALLREMVDDGISHAVMEVASHGLALHRVDGCRFRAVVFTNLTQDHLDFHGTMDEYRRAKQGLFEMVDADGVSVVNVDDPSGQAMIESSRARVVTYAIDQPADVRAADVRLDVDGTAFRVKTPVGQSAIRTRLRGKFNVSNALAAIATTHALGVTIDVAAAALAGFQGVPGRFEAVDEGQPFAVIVDYAHTPDSLENVLRTARGIARGKLIAVFGAGGDRDRTKRPLMGAIAVRLADTAIVTSDNPRSEEPMAIIGEIMSGVQGPASGVQIEVEPDRGQAIRQAIELAAAGDVVVIAGKGHEPYQEVKGVKHAFDDRHVAREMIRARATRRTQNPAPGTRP